MEFKRDWQNIILIPAILYAAYYFGKESQIEVMTRIIAIGTVCLFFANLHRFSKFKGGGIEAELAKAVEEASATLDNLKVIAKPLILSTLDNLTWGGRWGGMAAEKKHELKKEIDQVIDAFSIEDENIKRAQEKFHFMHSIDHINYIATKMSKNEIKNPDVMKQVRSLFNPDLTKPPKVEEVKKALEGLSDNEINILQPYIDDYEYYLEHNQVRRPEALRDE